MQINKYAFGLCMLMALTRMHHFGDAISLPDASLAVFFMAGLWVGGYRCFSVLLAEAGLLDYLAISQFNVNDYCISPAYLFLIPTYAVVFWAGKAASFLPKWQPKALLIQFAILAGATSIAFLISNGSFYLFSGRFADLGWSSYWLRTEAFYLPYLHSTLFYVVTIVGAVRLIQSYKAEAISHDELI